MRSTIITLTLWGICGSAWAGAPQYDRDPFGDSDFADAPLILDTAHPSRGRGELGLMFSSSLIDKYNSHMGGMVDFTYHFTRTLGLNLSVGYMHGGLTNIVKDGEGILGNRVVTCLTDGCDTVNPDMPDYRQITGVIDAMLIWTPLYGKLNIVSELDINLELYGGFGAGVNGTRQAHAELDPTSDVGYALSGESFGDAGFLGDPVFNMVTAVGLKVFLTDWLELRGEVRGLFYRDSFDFSGDGIPENYWTSTFFGYVGLGFILF